MEEGVLVARSLGTDRRIAPRLPEGAVTVACHEWCGRSGDTRREKILVARTRELKGQEENQALPGVG